MTRLVIAAAFILAGAAPAAVLAQDAEAPAAPASAPAKSAPPTTNSGVLTRVPLDKWMPEACPNPERRGEIVVCGRPDEEPTIVSPPPPPGERGADVQSERANLIAPESAAPSTACSAVGAAGDVGCSRSEYEQWKRERALQKAQEKVPKPR